MTGWAENSFGRGSEPESSTLAAAGVALLALLGVTVALALAPCSSPGRATASLGPATARARGGPESSGVASRERWRSGAGTPRVDRHSGYATPRGRFLIIRRERKSWSYPYHLWLPYALYFYRGWAIHGFPVVPDQPASHGCIRVPTQDARLLFQDAPLGTRVIIRGRPSPSLIAPSDRASASRRRTRQLHLTGPIRR